MRDILSLPLLAAPIGATVAATTGVTVLWALGSVTDRMYAQTWVHWWLGDVVGMVVVSPLLFALWGYGLAIL